jgi:TP53 regulating kinase-like protein
MVKARQLGVSTPALYHVNSVTNEIFMEYVNGCTVKQYLLDNYHQNEMNKTIENLAEHIGENIAILHSGNIVHGDLTTSNMMLTSCEPRKLVMIDFGLSFISTLVEDMAVDLYVLERAMLSTHLNSEKLVSHTFLCFSLLNKHIQSFISFSKFEHLLLGYKRKFPKQSSQVLAKLDQVRQRGRKRSMVG